MDYAFEWDERKRTANRAKHHMDFADVARFGWTHAEVLRDTRKDYAEPRFIGYGWLEGFRRANRREQAAYHSRSV